MSQQQKQQQPEEKKGFSNPEIMAIESDRQDASTWNVIHLLRDGDYWHANEWSGWLMGVVVHNEMKRRYPDVEHVAPKPVKKFAKNINGEYIFVGCQEKSFDKYIPKEIQLDFKPVDNLRIDIPIELPAEITINAFLPGSGIVARFFSSPAPNCSRVGMFRPNFICPLISFLYYWHHRRHHG